MQRLRRLVSGTDFSEHAEQALEVAIKLAVAPARIALVHVCELGADDRDDARLLQCGEALAELVAKHRCGSVELTGVLRSGMRPWEKLDNVAAEVGASLIVVGRHGAGRRHRVAIGSVAAQLVRSASRPVLTVPCDFDHLDHEAHETNLLFEKTKTS